DKIVCIMVGLPARGKSYISRRLAPYVSFFYGAPAKVFNVGDYRRKIARTTSMADFFDSSNQAAMKARAQACEEALTDLKRWIGETPSQQQRLDQKLHQSGDFGSLAIFDATNSTQSRRAWLVEQLKDTGAKVIFIESVCRDERLVQQTILHAKESVGNHDYEGVDPAVAIADFEARIRHYEQWVDAKVSLAADGSPVPCRLWTSSLLRTRRTARHISTPVAFRNLDELYAGLCDGMTYEEIADNYPDEAEARGADKFQYRYPRGESYTDLIARLEPLAHELERSREPVVIVAHQAIHRVLFAYFMGMPREECIHVSIPLNTVIKITPTSNGCEE
ncbi:hypothetical protein EMIHUDRAFT_41870, partial [Emiliania huxleyi CCMP1516]|uniref:6-phosphofructo-2-kinase domain-containing protein n=2 Tax=Emiliania huxleyi TaxID=2903 RepID=A0A0D3J3X8_EMIH1